MSRFLKFLISFLIFATLCFFGLQWFVNTEVDKELSQAVAKTPGLAFSYGDVSVNIFSHTVTLNSVDALFPTGQHVQAAQLQIVAFDQINPMPHYVTALVKGMTIPVTPQNFGPWSAYLKGLDINELTGDGSLDYTFDPANKTLKLKALSLDDPKLGALHLSGTLGNLDLDSFRVEQTFSISINQARVQFDNHTLMQLLTADWSRKMGIPKAETLARMSREIETLANYAKTQENGPAENVFQGLRDFLNKPETLTLSVNPTKPVPLLYFFMGRDMFENLQLLNIGAENNSHDGY